jgi:nucleoside-diphosphate-sugar epimerase
MRVLITGVTGFLGRPIAAQALRRSLEVRGLSRRPQTTDFDVIQGDLEYGDPVDAWLEGIDVMVHAAAGASSDATLTMTSRLLRAMGRVGTRKLVLVSSLAVLDYRALRVGDEVTEQTAVEPRPQDRDDYARAKLKQEELARQWMGSRQLCIVRPGAVVAAGRAWTPRLGFRLGARRWVQVGSDAELPLVHVDACAAGIVSAAIADVPPPVVHLLNARPPTQQQYIDEMVSRGELSRPATRIGYRAVRAIACAGWPALRCLPTPLRRRAPGALVPARVDARFKPLRFSTVLARPLFGDEYPDVSALELLR